MKKVVFFVIVLFLLTTSVYFYYNLFHKSIVGKNIRPENVPVVDDLDDIRYQQG